MSKVSEPRKGAGGFEQVPEQQKDSEKLKDAKEKFEVSK